MNDIKLLYIDLFCGAGGTTTGVERASINGHKCAKVIACVNHDPNAILSHAANHPDVLHFTEDIRTLDLMPLIEHIKKCRCKHPNAMVVLWASLECTNFSNAKGGKPRNADSRTLAEHLFRYIDAINPDYIQIENVREFMSWGDLDKNGHPVSKDKGRCFVKWVKDVCGRGYNYDFRLLNSADFGAYTSRTRYFGLFAKKGMQLAFPAPTHAKKVDYKNTLFDIYQKWKPVREVLDLQDEGDSIFNRKKPLAEKTLERIFAGLVKFVAGGRDEFLTRYNKAHYLIKNFSGDPNSKVISIDQPCGTLTCIDHHSFVTAYYGNGFNHSVDEPAPTQTTNDRLALVTTKFFQNEYSGGGQVSSIEEPNPAMMTIPKQKLVSVRQYLANPFSFKSDGGSINDPCFTLIARMDKMPPYLVTTKEGVGVCIYVNDTPMMRKIKEFMAIYGIIDIRMRMLNISEIKRIQGFPTDYILYGTMSEQKKFLGNAVVVNMGEALCSSLARCVS